MNLKFQAVSKSTLQHHITNLLQFYIHKISDQPSTLFAILQKVHTRAYFFN